MRYKLLLTAILSAGALNAQISEGFEGVQLDSGKMIDGSDGTKFHSFSTGEMNFPVAWDTTYKYWASGWALSKVIYNKVEPSNYVKHQFAAAPGYGVENGKGKAFLAGQGGSNFRILRKSAGDYPLKGFYVANSTYAYNSMQLGDFVGKKFGGNAGTDKDSFVLNIDYFKEGKKAGNKRVVLADFRFDDSTKDFISNQWIFVQSPDAYADSIAFALSSSDNGQFGMNTPSFFVLDGIEFAGLNTTEKTGSGSNAKVYPVPADSYIQVKADNNILELLVVNASGQVVFNCNPNAAAYSLQTMNWFSGIYFLQIRTPNGTTQHKLQVLH